MTLIWLTFLKVAGIFDLNRMPVIDDPEHNDVKAIVYLYSMESFLYRRINQISRDKDATVVNNLGPYAVALTRIIKYAEKNKENKLNKEGEEFTVYRGLSLPNTLIDEWNNSEFINHEGFCSTTHNKKSAISFAVRSDEDDRHT